jgi:hypothetical protein
MLYEAVEADTYIFMEAVVNIASLLAFAPDDPGLAKGWGGRGGIPAIGGNGGIPGGGTIFWFFRAASNQSALPRFGGTKGWVWPGGGGTDCIGGIGGADGVDAGLNCCNSCARDGAADPATGGGTGAGVECAGAAENNGLVGKDGMFTGVPDGWTGDWVCRSKSASDVLAGVGDG